jgi:(5-formylfuran-3-yl)methyl phosphate synthase
MQLLVSVANAAEAVDAVAGGADVIDAKDAAAGPLGPVTVDVLTQIHARVAGSRPVSAALGDATDEHSIHHAAASFARAGAAFVKVGFAEAMRPEKAETLLQAAVSGTRIAGGGVSDVIAVAYADIDRAEGLSPEALIQIAARVGARGVLVDTADKDGAGLLALVPQDRLIQWVVRAHAHGLLAALAGKLTAQDLPLVAGMGADVAGVRGAACDGGRTGRVSIEKVRLLSAFCSRSLDSVRA